MYVVEYKDIKGTIILRDILKKIMWGNKMRKEITEYFEKINKNLSYYYNSEDFSNLDKDIKCFFKRYGIVPKERKDKTDISLFKKEFGYQLPDEIAKYINIF